MLVGLRGVGKTVLLNRIDRQVREAGFHTAFLEAPEGIRLADLLAPEIRKLLLQIDTLEGAKTKMRTALGALRSFASAFKISIGDVGIGIAPPPGISDSGHFDRDLTDLFVAAGEAAAEKNTVIALLIDELQYVPEADLGALIAALHRVSQLNLPMVLFGAGLPQLTGLIGNAKSYSERLFVIHEIGQLPPPDAKRALEEPVERLGVHFASAALDQILQDTERYPYFLQEWGRQVWHQAKASPITLADAIAATEPAVAELDRSFFRIRFDRLTPSEKDYLRAMAQLGPGSHRSGDIAAVLHRPVEQVAPIRAKVIAKGMVYAPGHGDTAFTVPKFDEYMRRAIPTLTLRAPRRRQAE